MLQAMKGQIPDQQNYHDPILQNNKGETVSILLAQNGIIPPRQWIHDSTIHDNEYYTVEYYLSLNKCPIPNQWYNKKYQNQELNKIQFQQAMYNEDINGRNINSDEQNPDGWTIAMIQAFNGKISEDRFNHNKYKMNKYGQTVEDILINKNIQVPQNWKCDQKIKELYRQFCINSNITYYYKIRPQFNNNNKQRQTFAIFLSKNQVIPPKQYYHNPNITDKDNHTVCYYLFNSGLEIPEYWQDEQYKNPRKDQIGNTKAMQQVIYQKILPQKEYYHNPSIQNKDGQTVAMLLAQNQIIPPKQWYHNSTIRDNRGFTVALLLSQFQQQIPQEWNHDPNISDDNGNTVAINLARHGCEIIPDEWKHDPLKINNNGITVAIGLSANGIIPDKYWMHDINKKDNYGNSIKSNLLRFGYIYKNKQFILNVKTIKKKELCVICLNDDTQLFIKTKCGHNVCFLCYKELIKQNISSPCPQCKKQDWVIKYQ